MIVTLEDMKDPSIVEAFRNFLNSGGYGPQLLRSKGLTGVRVSTATADQLFREYRANNIKGEYYKGLRPWEMLDFRARFPRADVMVGVEVECGFTSARKLTAAYRHLMDKCAYATADTEGYGEYPLEATFPPVPAELLLSEGCQLLGFYDKVLSKEDELWSKGSMIGTHFNVSFPELVGIKTSAYNKMPDRCDAVSHVCLNECNEDREYCCEDCDGDYDDWCAGTDSSERLSTRQQVALFGRMPYGGVYLNSAANSSWIEMKLFNSTTNIDKLRWYKEVALTITHLLRNEDLDPMAVLSELATRSPLDSNGNMAKVAVAKKPRTIRKNKEKSLAVAG